MDTTHTPDSTHAPNHTEDTDPQARQRTPPPSIPGWGADLDHANRPAYPKERTPPRLENVHWERPAEQERRVRVFHSIERPGLTPVFGTSVPPKGLSGLLRGVAYRYSENDLRRWMILLAADRVNVGEGLLEDLAHGHIPNLFAEMGGPVEWRHNRAGFLRKAMAAGAIVGVAVWLLRRRNEH